MSAYSQDCPTYTLNFNEVITGCSVSSNRTHYFQVYGSVTDAVTVSAKFTFILSQSGIFLPPFGLFSNYSFTNNLIISNTGKIDGTPYSAVRNTGTLTFFFKRRHG